MTWLWAVRWLMPRRRAACFSPSPSSRQCRTNASRGTPRNAGFEYNWARDGSTTADLIAEGQHTGAEGQVAAGKVQTVLMEIGGNDWRGIFGGGDPTAIATGALTNTVTAGATMLGAPGNARVAVANVPDITLLPEARFAAMADPTLAPLLAQVSGAINQYNTLLAAQLDTLPGNERVALVDINGIFDGIINTPASRSTGTS